MNRFRFISFILFLFFVCGCTLCSLHNTESKWLIQNITHTRMWYVVCFGIAIAIYAQYMYIMNSNRCRGSHLKTFRLPYAVRFEHYVIRTMWLMVSFGSKSRFSSFVQNKEDEERQRERQCAEWRKKMIIATKWKTTLTLSNTRTNIAICSYFYLNLGSALFF